MEDVAVNNAYYIKLGRGGEFADWSIDNHRLWFGWNEQSPEEINEAVESSRKGDDTRWGLIRDALEQELKNKPKSVATAFFHQLKHIAESTSNDVWITFHKSHLWWCRLLEDSPVCAVDERDFQQGGSGGPKYRTTKGWSNQDVAGNRLVINQISGRLSQTQGFRGTSCTVTAVDDLKRLLNNRPSVEYSGVQAARDALIAEVEGGIQRLFWNDFEILTDLLFGGSGWRRISSIGGTMKDVDMEYRAPVTDYLYQVQVKSTATLDDFHKAVKSFPAESFRKLYFVVHSPEGQLATAVLPDSEKIELVLPRRLAEMAVDLGLVDWLLGKIK